MTNISSDGGDYVAKNKLSLPHGAIGEFIKEINDKLLFIKSEHIATIDALLVVSSISARYFLTPTRALPIIYAFIIGESGCGKSGVEDGLNAIRAQLNNKFSEFPYKFNPTSLPALNEIYAVLSKHPNMLLSLPALDNTILNPKAQKAIKIVTLLKSIFDDDEYSKQNSITRPVIVVYSEMTTEIFLPKINNTASDSILSRFLYIRTPEAEFRPIQATINNRRLISEEALSTLKNIIDQSEYMLQTNSITEITDDAFNLFNDFHVSCLSKSRELPRGTIELSSYTRLANYALRIATLIAVYNAHDSNKQGFLDKVNGGITTEDMAYGIYYVSYYHNAFLADLHAGNINEGDSSRFKQLEMVLNKFTSMTESEAIEYSHNGEYGKRFDLELWQNKIISHSLIVYILLRRKIFSGAPTGGSDSVNKTINGMIDCGTLTLVKCNEKKGKFYQIKK